MWASMFKEFSSITKETQRAAVTKTIRNNFKLTESKASFKYQSHTWSVLMVSEKLALPKPLTYFMESAISDICFLRVRQVKIKTCRIRSEFGLLVTNDEKKQETQPCSWYSWIMRRQQHGHGFLQPGPEEGGAISGDVTMNGRTGGWYVFRVTVLWLLQLGS